MENVVALQDLAIIIGAGVIAAFIATKLRMPTLIGYLFAGIIIALIFPGMQQSELTANIAQLGAALLLFTVGVEFSMSALKKVSKIVVAGAIVQALLVIVFGLLLLPLLGYNDYEAFLIGTLISTSSTVFVVKMLEAKDQLHTRAGLIMLGWLVMQDLLIIIWFLLFQTFSPSNETAPDFLLALFKGAIVIGVTYGIGKYVLPPIMQQIAKTRSDELLVVSVVGVIALFAVFANLFDVSFTIGAFLAGLALSESFLNHEIFTEIKPIRNLFTMIFFVSIGMILNLSAVVDNFGHMLLILGVLLPLKVIVIVLINLWFKVHIRNSLRVGLGISQIGEFAFLGAQIAMTSGWLDYLGEEEKVAIYSILVASTVISMALTPLLYGNAEWIYKLLEKNVKRISPNLYRTLFVNAREETEETDNSLEDHVVVCGYGRVGQYVVNALEHSHIPFVLIEVDSNNADLARKSGLKVIYGDASNPDILKQAGMSMARVLVATLPEKQELDILIRNTRQLNPQIKIVARLHKQLGEGGAESIDHPIEPELEAAVSIVATLYKLIHRRPKRAIETIREMQDS